MPDPLPPPLSAALQQLGQRLGVDTGEARALRLHDASTVLLPSQHLVVRFVTASEETHARAKKALKLTGWLASQAFPAVRPAVAEPIRVGTLLATVWQEIPRVPAHDPYIALEALGCLVRELHALPAPPVELPHADPLSRLRAALDMDTRRTEPVLTADDHDFLSGRLYDLQQRYSTMTFPLGVGLIHNDAHPGNLLPDPASAHGHVMTDWESACIGPREMDVVLVGAPGSRFGDTEEERLAFTAGYGYDIATWPGYRILRDIRDLHSLAGHIRAAPHKPAAINELRTRVRSLRDGDPTVRWNAI